MQQKKTVIVTGAAGFVGARLVKKLVEENYVVHAWVRSQKTALRLKNVLPKITLAEDVLSNPNQLDNLIKQVKPDAVCHLATYGAYPTQADPYESINTNIVATTNLLECLKNYPQIKLLVAGSSSEYGKKSSAMHESDLLEPNNFYAAAKAMQTHLTQIYALRYQIPDVVLRLFSVYGPEEEAGRLVRSVIQKALAGEDILLATGQEARDFIHVDDVVNAFLVLLNSNNLTGQIYNLGTGKQTTVLELSQLIIKLTKSKSKIKLNAYPGRIWDTTTWRASVQKTRKETDWKPIYTLSRGLKQTIAWYQNQS